MAKSKEKDGRGLFTIFFNGADNLVTKTMKPDIRAGLETAINSKLAADGPGGLNFLIKQAQEKSPGDIKGLMTEPGTGGKTLLMLTASTKIDAAGKIDALLKGAKGDDGEIYKSDINAKNKIDGKTALMYAAENGTQEAVKKLLDARADPLIQDKEGKTVLQMLQDGAIKAFVKQAFIDAQEELSGKIWEDRANRMKAALTGDFSKLFDSKTRNELRDQQKDIGISIRQANPESVTSKVMSGIVGNKRSGRSL